MSTTQRQQVHVKVESHNPALPGYTRTYELLEDEETAQSDHWLEWAPGAWCRIDRESPLIGMTAQDIQHQYSYYWRLDRERYRPRLAIKKPIE